LHINSITYYILNNTLNNIKKRIEKEYSYNTYKIYKQFINSLNEWIIKYNNTINDNALIIWYIFQKIIILYWFLAGACNISVLLFFLYNHLYLYMSVLATSIYIALHKILWAISIAWIVIACSTKHGGLFIY